MSSAGVVEWASWDSPVDSRGGEGCRSVEDLRLGCGLLKMGVVERWMTAGSSSATMLLSFSNLAMVKSME